MSGSSEYREVSEVVPAQSSERSIGELLSDTTRDLSTLLRQEVDLAKAELRESATQAGKGAGMLAGAGVAGHFTLLFLSLALWWALGQLTGLGWSAVIVAVIWGIVAGVLAAMGQAELKRMRGLPKTAETVSKIPNALKGHEEENR
jgi:Putative Actinobacterial Holin-X, holin superfamily III